MVGGTSPLSLDTLWLMGMVVCHNRHFILCLTIAQEPIDGKDEDDESDDESGSESSLPSNTELGGPSSLAATCP